MRILNLMAAITIIVIVIVTVAYPAGVAEAAPEASPGERRAVAIFAGGCFWCMEKPFDEVEGVLSTTAGYGGGQKKDPSYEEVSSGATGHAEVVKVEYDAARVTYEELLAIFWRNIDPTVKDRQFCDRGRQYRSAIFYTNESQRLAAEKSREQLSRNKPFAAPILTEIGPATAFYPAEAYHQDYYEKNPVRYRYYRYRCGRDQRLEALWGAKP